MCASRSTNQRKPTPCTRPRTRKRRASIASLVALTRHLHNILKTEDTGAHRVKHQENKDLPCDSLCPLCLSSCYVSSSSSGQISPIRRIHFDLFSLVDKGWYLDDQSGFRLCGLGHAGSCRAPDSRLGLKDSQFDGLL